MSKRITPKAKALLDAHVQFILNQIDGNNLKALIERELEEGLKSAKKITLKQAVTRDMIKDTARTYAAELELHGAIPELVGDIARTLYAHKIQDKTHLRDLLSDERFEEILDKVLELQDARKVLVHAAVTNPLFSEMAADLVYNGVSGYLAQSNLAKNIPGMQSMLKLGKSMMSKGMEASIEDNLKRYIHSSLKPVLKQSEHFLLHTINNDKLREVALEIWGQLKSHRVSAVRDILSSDDIEEFFVIAYEFWRELRQTDYYVQMIYAGIDGFFDKYGDSSLGVLLDEMGMTHELLMNEAMRYAPHVVKVLKKKKLLEPVIRRNLESFYHSTEAQAILSA